MGEVEKLHGLHNTGMTMHQRFTMLAQASASRRGKRNPFFARTRSQTNQALIEAIANQLEYQAQRPVRGMQTRSRGRGRGGLHRSGSEGSLRGIPGLRKGRSNSFGDMNQNGFIKEQRWIRSNGNLSSRSSMNGSVYSAAGSVKSRGFWLRGVQPGRGARGGGRARGNRGRAHRGRVTRVTEARGRGRPAQGSGRRGLRRSAGAPPLQPRGAPWRRGRGRGGILRNQTPKPVPTKEELDAELEQYMAGTKAALDKELDEYMRHAMDFD